MPARVFRGYACALFAVCLLHGRTAARQGDTVSVYFPLDVHALPAGEQQKLDSLRYLEILDIGRDLLIVGYADYVGDSAYNDTLSRQRAGEVRRYLLTTGYKPGQITLCIGKGAVPRKGLHDPRGHAPDRRVDIVLQGRTAGRRPVVAGKPVVRAAPPAKAPPAATPGPVIPMKEVKKYLDDILTVEVNEAVVLSHIFFPPNSHYITQESRKELERLVQVLKENPAMRIRIEGHICCVLRFPDAWDEDEGNYRLSVNRAFFIYDYLVRRGIHPDRLQYAGYGRRRPVVPVERTEEDGQKNRRVEVRVLTK